MAIPQQKKVDREQIYRDIAALIRKSPNNQVEVSSSDLADRFGVQPPSMDYHLNKLIEDGLLEVSAQRGRYNRKIYKLPESQLKEKEANPKVHMPFANEDSQNKFQNFLKKQQQKKIEEKPFVENHIEVPETKPEPVPELKVAAPEVEPEAPAPTPVPVAQEEAPEVEMKELTLDDRINQFIQATNRVHDADVLLSHEDKEILSVVNETIQQNVVYLKDLTEQLSTIQNKALIQHLIDDRNTMQSEMKRLQQEAEDARALASQTVEKYKIEPRRVRNMQQILVDTVDQYVKLPNHAMALGRQDFRRRVTKEIKDLVDYVLHIEK